MYARWSMKRYQVTRLGSFLSEKAYAVGLGDVRALARAAKVNGQTLRRLCLGGTVTPITLARLGTALELGAEDKARLMKLAKLNHNGNPATVEAMEIMDAAAKAGSQAELARISGVQPTTISEAINGVRIPRPSTMRKIREAVAA